MHSLFSAARAHSRLHQAAVLAASSVKAILKQQQKADSVLRYLANHGQHVDSIDIQGSRSSTAYTPRDALVCSTDPCSCLHLLLLCLPHPAFLHPRRCLTVNKHRQSPCTQVLLRVRVHK